MDTPAADALQCEIAVEVLRSFGNLRFAATGWSMLPAILPNDILFVDRMAPSEIVVGNVILFGRDSRLCAHRVIAISDKAPMLSGGDQRLFITQGDALLEADSPIGAGEILGRVTCILRQGRILELPNKRARFAQIIRRSKTAAYAFIYYDQARRNRKLGTLEAGPR